MRLSEHVEESLTPGGSTCVSHQFLKSVLLFTATSSSLAGRESPKLQRVFIAQPHVSISSHPRRDKFQVNFCNQLPTNGTGSTNGSRPSWTDA